jgi:hypothetical protein
LAFYDESLKLVVEAGEVRALIGSSSADIRLQTQFKVTGPAKTAIEHRVFDCPVDVDPPR